MKITVVCGLLGAGKTTFIQQYLKYSSEKVLVIVNDFGKGIDGEILSSDGIEYIELPSGCVCCTLKFDLITTLKMAIQKFSPDHLIIEPSGVAAPSNILDAISHLPTYPMTVVGIVDASEFADFYDSGMYGNFFEDQIRSSDFLLLNKIDLSDRAKIERAVKIIKSINPEAVIIETVRSSINMPLPERNFRTREQKSHHHSLRLDSFSMFLTASVGLNLIKIVFDEMARGDYGNILRAKALVETDRGPFRIDLSSGVTECIPFQGLLTKSRLVVIGDKIDSERLSMRINSAQCYE